MNILLNILIGLAALVIACVAAILVFLLVVLLLHERRWRRIVSDQYKTYNNGGEKER